VALFRRELPWVSADGQPLFEIQFDDGQWILAVLADLSV
jgi:hypothetical protein